MGKAIPTRVAETTAIISITRIVDNHAAALRRAHHFGIWRWRGRYRHLANAPGYITLHSIQKQADYLSGQEVVR